MKILITNDDGIESPGLEALRERFSEDHDVLLVAPDSERSGKSHSMTLHEPVRIKKIGPARYSCSGSPADCVIMTRLGAIAFDPDIVVSGINNSPNLGTDIVYSGTCAAARQAAFYRIPAVAISLSIASTRFASAAAYIARTISEYKSLWRPGMFFNVNVPPEADPLSPAVWTIPSKRVYGDSLVRFDAPDGFAYCFLTGGRAEAIPKNGDDFVSDGRISCSPVAAEPSEAYELFGSALVPGAVGP
jgi:5'-nucleotidase